MLHPYWDRKQKTRHLRRVIMCQIKKSPGTQLLCAFAFILELKQMLHAFVVGAAGVDARIFRILHNHNIRAVEPPVIFFHFIAVNNKGPVYP
jgi:hypothetical protein